MKTNLLLFILGRPPGTRNKAKLAFTQGIAPSSPPPLNHSYKSYTMPNLSDSNHDYSMPISEVILTTDTDTTNSSDTTLASATNNSTDSQPTTPGNHPALFLSCFSKTKT